MKSLLPRLTNGVPSYLDTQGSASGNALQNIGFSPTAPTPQGAASGYILNNSNLSSMAFDSQGSARNTVPPECQSSVVPTGSQDSSHDVMSSDSMSRLLDSAPASQSLGPRPVVSSRSEFLDYANNASPEISPAVPNHSRDHTCSGDISKALEP